MLTSNIYFIKKILIFTCNENEPEDNETTKLQKMLRFKLFQTHSNHISQEEKRLLKHFKVDEYVVREKGRNYSVLVFPFVKYMWVFNDWPGEDCYMVDGSAEAFSMLKYALAILIEASDKIIYFPYKQEGIGTFYNENYNLV